MFSCNVNCGKVQLDVLALYSMYVFVCAYVCVHGTDWHRFLLEDNVYVKLQIDISVKWCL